MSELWKSTEPLLRSIHPEIWGVTLANPSTHIPSQVVLQKYLNANDQDVSKALDQLTKTLQWRKETKPLELLEAKFSGKKFGGLGYVSVYGEKDKSGDPAMKEVFTWNIYGGVKSVDETFGKLDESDSTVVLAVLSIILTFSQVHPLARRPHGARPLLLLPEHQLRYRPVASRPRLGSI